MSAPAWQRWYHPWVFIAPAGILLGLFVVLPMALSAYWSLHGVDLKAPFDGVWVGGANYSDLLADPRFRQAFRNTALFALMVVPVQTVAALALALWVNRPEPWWRWLRGVFFVPMAVSMPVLAILWAMLYQSPRGDEMGLVNLVVSAVGLEPQAWLKDPHLALPAIALMSIWQGVGFQMMIFLAALQNVRREQIEAALIDGAGWWARLAHVVLPAIRNSIAFAVIITTILSFRLFAQPYLMTKGGPDGATVSLVMWIYNHLRQLGWASSATLVFLAVVAVLSFVQRRLAKETRA